MILDAADWYEEGQNSWYLPGKFLNVGQGNNAFSLPKRPERSSLWITPLRIASIDDLKKGEEIVF